MSLAEDDVRRLDEYAAAAGLPSRSAAIQRAIQLLSSSELESAYASAWSEWHESGDASAWGTTASDRLVDAAP